MFPLVLVNRLGGPRLARNSVVSLTDRPGMFIAVNHVCKTTKQKSQHLSFDKRSNCLRCLVIMQKVAGSNLGLATWQVESFSFRTDKATVEERSTPPFIWCSQDTEGP